MKRDDLFDIHFPNARRKTRGQTFKEWLSAQPWFTGTHTQEELRRLEGAYMAGAQAEYSALCTGIKRP